MIEQKRLMAQLEQSPLHVALAQCRVRPLRAVCENAMHKCVANTAAVAAAGASARAVGGIGLIAGARAAAAAIATAVGRIRVAAIGSVDLRKKRQYRNE